MEEQKEERSRRFGDGWRWSVAAATMVTADWLAVLGSLWLCWALRNGVLLAWLPGLGRLSPFLQYVENLYFLLPWVLAFAEAGLYVRRVSFWDEVRQVSRACTIAALFSVFLSVAVHSERELSRLVIVSTWVLTLFVVPVVRHNVKIFIVGAGLWGRRVLILGAGKTGTRVCESIRTFRALGYEPVAFVDDDPAKIGGAHLGLPVRGPLASVPALVRELGVKDVVVAMPRLARERLLHVIKNCEGHVRSIRVVPDMLGLATVGVETQDLNGLLLLRLRWNLAKPWNVAIKRGFDVVVAGMALLLLSPLLAAIYAAIRLDSPGEAIFRQERLGNLWGRFSCAKFRSMYCDGDRRLHDYLESHPEVRSEWEQFAKLRAFDPRVTPVGRFMRRLSIDELPQLWNVLKGEMSLVGPRPYLPREVDMMGEAAETILKASPGMTGLWQVSGRNELSFGERLKLDEYYVRNWSLWMDLMVLARTFGVVLTARGAY